MALDGERRTSRRGCACVASTRACARSSRRSRRRGQGPEAAGAIVTRVEMARRPPDARACTCGCSRAATTPARRRDVVDALRRASGMLRREVTQRLGLRYAPELKFLYDDGARPRRRASSSSSPRSKPSESAARSWPSSQPRDVPGAAPGGHLADRERARAPVDDEREARAGDDPERLLPAVPRGRRLRHRVPELERDELRAVEVLVAMRQRVERPAGRARRRASPTPCPGRRRRASRPSRRAETGCRSRGRCCPARWPRAGACART